MADKYKIIFDATLGMFDEHELGITGLDNGIDEYMKETCLELLEYMAKNDVKCTWYEHEVRGIVYAFNYKGESLSKEQLFENFL